MSWFESQIQKRRSSDQQLLEDSFVRIAGVVLGEREAEKFNDDRIVTKNAIDEILKYYHVMPLEIPEELNDMEKQLDYCLRYYGFMRREVGLTEGWYKDAFGPMLTCTKDDGLAVALLPDAIYGYVYNDPKTGARIRVNSKTAQNLEKEALCFYRPLPQKKLSLPDLLLYMKNCISMNDVVITVVSTLALTMVGLIMPRVIRALTGPILLSGRASALAGVLVCILCVSLATQLINSVKTLVRNRLGMKTSLAVEASMMMRLLSLPANFFREYSPGELKSRAMSVNQLFSMLLDIIMGVGLTSITSLLYVGQIFKFAPALAIPSVLIVLITEGFSILSTMRQIQINRQQMKYGAKESGMSYSLITGVQKIKLAGAEKRIFSKWLNLYAQGVELQYNPPLFIKINGVIAKAISLASTIVLYYLAMQSGLDQSSYFAFTASYGLLMGTFASMSDIALSAARIRPVLEMAEPFLKIEPETAVGKEIVTHLSGGIEMEHVSFRYDDQSTYVLDDLTLKVHPGDYVAIVGRTGCGKSTLVRLLLGFEKPEKGAVYYDGKDIGSLDLPSLRKQVGTVMQDAGLFQGDIYSNIVITAPELTEADAWEAAEKADIAEDIKAMPMQMNTIVSEGQGGISGGQRQRLMIARAIAPKPKILIFDEATSALDNKTQKQISEALDSMGCTRIVIAHRLSTIRHCNRILVLDGGKIVEEGTYEELIQAGGLFADLVERQRLDH